MRTPVVDYRKFRLSKINSPEFKHLQYLFGWLGYFALYFLTENLIPHSRCYVVHSPLDEIIPFCEYFVIPYVGWYLLIVVSLLYFALYNIDNFISLQKFIIVTNLKSRRRSSSARRRRASQKKFSPSHEKFSYRCAGVPRA